MSEFVLPEILPNERANLVGLDLIPATFGQGFGAAFDDAMARNPTSTLFRALDRLQYFPSTDELGNEIPARTPATILTPDEANAKYGIKGHLKFDADVPEPIAAELQKLKQNEIQRQDVLRRAQAGLGTSLTAGLVASLLDPLNVASAFLPVVGPARYAAMVTRFGVGGARAARGALEGAAGAALLEPIILAGARYEQADYDIGDSLANVTFGTILGSGLHLAGGAVGDRLAARRQASPFQRAIDDLPLADQEALARTAIAQTVEGRPVDVSAVLDVVQTSSRQRLLAGAASFADRSTDAPDIRFALQTPDADAILRRQAPELAAQADELRRQQTVLRASLDEMGDDKLTVAATKYDQQIAALQKELETAPKKRGREIVAELSDLYTERAKAREAAAAAPADIPEMTAIRQQLVKTDEALRDLAVELTAATARAEQKAANLRMEADRVTRKFAPLVEINRSLETTLFPLDRPPGAFVSAARVEASVRGLDTEAQRAAAAVTDRAAKEQGAPKSLADEIKGHEDDIAYLESLTPAEARDRLAASAEEKEATVYAKAFDAAAACAVRKG